jgi:hypothetical protein
MNLFCGSCTKVKTFCSIIKSVDGANYCMYRFFDDIDTAFIKIFNLYKRAFS